MSKACLLLFLVGVVVFIITPSIANQHHGNELPKGNGRKPFPGEKQPQHKPFPEHRPPIHRGPGGKGEEPPHGEKPPHRHLLNVEVEGTHKPPRYSGGKPPRHSGGKPPHVEGFLAGKAPMKPFPGDKPSKGNEKGAPHEPKPPHRHLLSVEVEGTHKPPQHSGGKPPRHSGGKPPHVEGFPGDKPSKGKGKGAPHEPKPPHRHILSVEVEGIHKPPQQSGGKPPRHSGGKPPHVEGFPGDKPSKGKGKGAPHEPKPPHRHLLNVEVEDTHKPPQHSGGKPPHVEGFPDGKPPIKPFPGDKPSKGKGKGVPHEPKPPHRHLLSEPHKYVIPPKGKGEKPPHEQKPHHGHHPRHHLGIEN
ncbi:early nodulin-75-like [Gossypium arboreum]|uniref:Early nodulin-75-like n=1 Tax=Gossypium arboreum TaxID=29729 RepID=A0ABR0NIW0_GOSAR|nr:early nodulin-75-like [Gossypium arboreum]KAK5794161.1 hypothetical protein PVK06_035368 [Gossypium arboreum]